MRPPSGFRNVRVRWQTLRHRWRSTTAVSDSVTQTGWILSVVLLGIVVIAGTVAVPGSPVRAWIQSQAFDVSTISSVQEAPNTAGGGSAQDWVLSTGADTLTPTVLGGINALQWNNPASGYNWVWEYVNVANHGTYRFTVALAGTGEAWLNVWNGSANVPSSPVELTGGWQTETLVVTMSESAGDPSPPEIQVATTQSPTTVDFQQATVVPA